MVEQRSVMAAFTWVAHENLCLNTILTYCARGAKRRSLPGLCKGTSIGALGLTEIGAGTTEVRKIVIGDELFGG